MDATTLPTNNEESESISELSLTRYVQVEEGGFIRSFKLMSPCLFNNMGFKFIIFCV